MIFNLVIVEPVLFSGQVVDPDSGRSGPDRGVIMTQSA